MPSDLQVPSVGPASPISGTAVRAGRAGAAPAAAAPTASPALPNPTLDLDPQLGIVVIEFRSEDGAVTTSIPTAQQLDAYRSWEQTHAGPRPRGQPGPAPAASSRAPG